MIEIFKDIKDLEGKYQVSNLGQILSLNYNHTGKPKLMKPHKTKKGYLNISLFKNGKQKMFQIHRLVAEAFLPNPENKPCVNHKIEGDEGKRINIVYLNDNETVDEEKSTIEWCTVKENINYGTSIQRTALTNSKVQKNNQKKSKPVLQFTLDGEFVREWPSIKECYRNGFDNSAVCKCCKEKLKSHKGFFWRYKE